jgi:hypothetical protein
MVYKKLLIIPAVLLFMSGCNPAYLSSPYNSDPNAVAPLANADSWYWDTSCNCWVNKTYQAPPPAAPVTISSAPCSGGCGPATQLPPPPYCPPGNPCPSSSRAVLPPGNAYPPAPVATLPPALPATTPQYWDPQCQCWANAQYVDKAPATTAAPADGTALIIARDAQQTAQRALEESRANTERLNRAYRRSLEK